MKSRINSPTRNVSSFLPVFKSDKNIYLYKKLGYETFRAEQAGGKLGFVFMEKTRGKE